MKNMIKRFLVVFTILGWFFDLGLTSGLARWRDQGQSEKYFKIWEEKSEWEPFAIEGYALLLQQNYQGAQEKLQKAIARGCSLGKIYFQLGLCFDKLNQPQEAIQNYKRALEIFPTATLKKSEQNIEEYTFLTHHNLGVVYLEQSRDSDAVQEFEKAAQLKPEDASTQVNLGILYSKNDMFEKAIDAYGKALKYDTQSALAHYNLSVLLRKMGEKEEAQKHLESAMSIDPSLEKPLGKATESTEIKNPFALTQEEVLEIKKNASSADDLIALGNLYLARLEFENALSSYEEAITKDPKKLDAYLGKARVLLRLDRSLEAEKVFYQALLLNPNQWEAHIQLGKIYYDLGRIQMACKEFEKANKLKENQVDTLFFLGVVNEYQGEERYGKGFPVDQAKQYYEKVLEMDPKHMQARTNLANVYARLGDWDQAKKEFEKASEVASDSAYAHYNLGYIYDELGLRKQSIAEYLKAVELNPKLTDAYFNLGFVYGEHKLFKYAEKEYLKVLDLDRNYADAYFNLGILYDRYLKDKDKAHTYYHEYALRSPNAPMDEKRVLKRRIIKLYP
ncbi:MAG: tetratricopeptide repeat protein [Chlamydiae bacterium]|nr:tetratricopeptide repeat protein [Chlamydiota bacterium]MBI3276524.1 tetratricopeptide repeat protein [Chlamydiota bacterium]